MGWCMHVAGAHRRRPREVVDHLQLPPPQHAAPKLLLPSLLGAALAVGALGEQVRAGGALVSLGGVRQRLAARLPPRRAWESVAVVRRQLLV